MEDREAGPDLVREREEVELGAELAVVAALGFLEPVQVLLERLVVLPRGAVDALEHRALLVTPPVRAGDLRQLERAELAGRRDVRAAAQVHVRHAAVGVQVLVDADRAVAGDLARVLVVGGARADVADDLLLERLVREQLQAAVEVVLLAHERLVLGHDLAHPRLDALEVRLGEVLAVGQLEVVVEAVGDRGADRVLRPREQVEDRLGHQVRGRVPQHLPARVRVRGDDRDARVVLDRPGEIDLLPVDRGRDRGLGEALADRRGDVAGGRAPGQLLRRPVRQRDRDRLRSWLARGRSGRARPRSSQRSVAALLLTLPTRRGAGERTCGRSERPS